MPNFTGDATTALMETTSTMLEPTITPTEPSTAPGFSETGEWERATRRMCGDFLQRHLGHRVWEPLEFEGWTGGVPPTGLSRGPKCIQRSTFWRRDWSYFVWQSEVQRYWEQPLCACLCWLFSPHVGTVSYTGDSSAQYSSSLITPAPSVVVKPIATSGVCACVCVCVFACCMHCLA